MGSPFKMTPGGPGKGTARTTGSGLAMRGLVNPSPAPTHMHEGKVHNDARSGDELPSYEVKSSKHSASLGSGSEGKIKTGKDVGVSQSKVNDYNMKKYGTLTPTKDGLTNNKKPASSGGSSSVDSSEKIALGDKTLNQVKKDAQNTADNRVSFQGAKDEREIQRQVKDSSDAANRSIQKTIDRQGPEVMQGAKGDLYRQLAQKKGDAAAVEGTVQRRNEKRQKGKAQSIKRFYGVKDDERARIAQSVKENVSAKPRG